MGKVRGKIVEPRGENHYTMGWDAIFQPDGYDKTFAEMSAKQKSEVSHRRMAINKLKEFLIDQE